MAGVEPHATGKTVPMDEAMVQEYLNDHLIGSAGAQHMLERLADRLEDPSLHQIVDELESEQEVIRRFMDEAGLHVSAGKPLVARIGEWASRLLRDLQATRRDELRDLLELEAMLVGIEGKRALWRSLMQVQPHVRAMQDLPLEQLEELHDQAFRQAQLVESRRLQAAASVLLEGWAPLEG